jgi:hypothetical protein
MTYIVSFFNLLILIVTIVFVQVKDTSIDLERLRRFHQFISMKVMANVHQM